MPGTRNAFRFVLLCRIMKLRPVSVRCEMLFRALSLGFSS